MIYKSFFKEYGFYIITSVVLTVVFTLGVVVGMYGKTGASLEQIEREQHQHQQAQSVTQAATVSEEETTASEAEPQYDEITVVATAYCPCVECSEGYGTMTATGVTAKAGRTIAVDPSVIPYGTQVIINGNTYVAEDCGGLIKGNKVDIYFDTHAEASAFGKQKLTAYILK